MGKQQHIRNFSQDTSSISASNWPQSRFFERDLPTNHSSLLQTRPFQNIAQQSPQIQSKSEASAISSNLLTQNPSLFNTEQFKQGLNQPVQAKLTIGKPNDRYEQEADRVAHEVVQRIHSSPSTGETENFSPNSNEESVQRQLMSPRHPLNSKSAPSVSSLNSVHKPTLVQGKQIQVGELSSGVVSSQFESSLNNAKSGGKVLNPKLRTQMESAMGADFSGIRVHDNSQSDTLNRSIQAKAFTTGSNIFFRSGEYNPHSTSGQELIAHELTHTLQQGAAPVSRQVNSPQANGTDSINVQKSSEDLLQRTSVTTSRKVKVRDQTLKELGTLNPGTSLNVDMTDTKVDKRRFRSDKTYYRVEDSPEDLGISVDQLLCELYIAAEAVNPELTTPEDDRLESEEAVVLPLSSSDEDDAPQLELSSDKAAFSIGGYSCSVEKTENGGKKLDLAFPEVGLPSDAFDVSAQLAYPLDPLGATDIFLTVGMTGQLVMAPHLTATQNHDGTEYELQGQADMSDSSFSLYMEGGVGVGYKYIVRGEAGGRAEAGLSFDGTEITLTGTHNTDTGETDLKFNLNLEAEATAEAALFAKAIVLGQTVKQYKYKVGEWKLGNLEYAKEFQLAKGKKIALPGLTMFKQNRQPQIPFEQLTDEEQLRAPLLSNSM